MVIDENIDRFLTESVGEYGRMEKLAGDASTREYYRVQSGEVSFVLCIDSNFIENPARQYPFFIVDDLLRKKEIHVPKIYAYDEKNGLILLEDGGDDHLKVVFPRLSRDEGLSLYKKLIDIIIDIHFIEGDCERVPFCLSFDVDKLMFEFDFFVENALKNYFRTELSRTEYEELRAEFIKISEILHRREYFVLNHRDFHSRNVLILQSKPFIIDFQDARMGLPQYDAVSLLRDSYLVLDDSIVEVLKEYHFNRLVENGFDKMTYDEYEYFFDIMAFQRNVKAIGTFGYQITSLGNRIYEEYIAPTLNYLPVYTQRRKELRRAGEILKKYVGGKQ